MISGSEKFETRGRHRNRVNKIIWYILAPVVVLCVFFAFTLTKNVFSLSDIFSTELIPLFVTVSSVGLAVIAWKIPLLLPVKSTPSYDPHSMTMIARYSILLAICFNGLLSALLVNNPMTALPSFAISVLGFVLSFPKAKDAPVTSEHNSSVPIDATHNNSVHISKEKLDQKRVSNPIWLTVLSIVLIFVGIVGVIFNISASYYKMPTESGVMTFLGSKGAIVIALGSLLRSRLRVKRPRVFYFILILLIGVCANKVFQVATAISQRNNDCVAECNSLSKNGQLKAGMTEDSCIQVMCSK